MTPQGSCERVEAHVGTFISNAPPSLAGKFEEGMAKTGQTRTHALLAYAFGIRSVVVAVTQLDNLPIPYSRKRYEWCQSEVIRYLKRVGFVQDRVTCLPVSGLCGDNIIEPSKNLPWCELESVLKKCCSHGVTYKSAAVPQI